MNRWYLRYLKAWTKRLATSVLGNYAFSIRNLFVIGMDKPLDLWKSHEEQNAMTQHLKTSLTGMANLSSCSRVTVVCTYPMWHTDGQTTNCHVTVSYEQLIDDSTTPDRWRRDHPGSVCQFHPQRKIYRLEKRQHNTCEAESTEGEYPLLTPETTIFEDFRSTLNGNSISSTG